MLYDDVIRQLFGWQSLRRLDGEVQGVNGQKGNVSDGATAETLEVESEGLHFSALM